MVSTTDSSSLPHWRLDSIFADLEAPEFERAFNEVVTGLDELATLCDRYDIRRQAARPLDQATIMAFEKVIARVNSLTDRLETVEAYLDALIATDTRNTQAQGRASLFRTRAIIWHQLEARLNAWIGSLDLDQLIERSAVAHEHEYALRQAVVAARHQMSEVEENLAAALYPSAGSAWARLHDDLTASLSVSITLDGEAQVLPMSAVRNLAYDPDPSVRRAAYASELRTWPTVEIPLAAALNGIKGEVTTLNMRRGWSDSVAPSLFASGIDAATLAAMQTAVEASLPAFRRYLRAKARLLGGSQLAWWDLFAPVGQVSRSWSYTDAVAFITDQFARYAPGLANLAQRAFKEGWIDAEPRVGKVGGAFCMKIRPGESRILCNYDGSFSSVGTLAHELGHAYHNHCLASRTALQRRLPMTLAETASIFCETLIEEAEIERSTGDDRLALLEYSLQNACQVVVDIHSRFLFEQSVFGQRAEREMAPAELCAAMLAAQEQTYGDGLDPSARHPYMWAVKSHYYSTGLSYYNYPYTFGQLFALGLFARRHQIGASFVAAYDALLAGTGMADAATLAASFGIDIRTPDFWHSSLALIIQRIDQFEALVPR